MKAGMWAALGVVLAAAPAWADDTDLKLLSGPVPDPNTWFEVSVNGVVDFWPKVSLATTNAHYNEAFSSTTGIDLQAGYVYSFNPKFWSYDTFVRPHLGYAYRRFSGAPFVDKGTGASVTLNHLEIQTLYAGVALGAGQFPVGSELCLITYVNFDIGIALMGSVTERAPALSAGDAEFLNSTENLYVSGGLGIEARISSFALHVEFGMRSFGPPDRASAPVAARGQPVVTLYFLFGVSVAF